MPTKRRRSTKGKGKRRRAPDQQEQFLRSWGWRRTRGGWLVGRMTDPVDKACAVLREMRKQVRLQRVLRGMGLSSGGLERYRELRRARRASEVT